MRTQHNKSVHVIYAGAFVVILGALLGARLLTSIDGSAEIKPDPLLATSVLPGHSALPEATGFHSSPLVVPRWGASEAVSWSVSFKTDLDRLAPLGTGNQNAAEYFKAFTKPDGPRFEEARRALERKVDHPSLSSVFAADEPLLTEAEPWCDQASMSYYPEIFQIDGYFDTRIPNLLVPLHLARGWVARGLAAEDPEQAMEDFRRAIRLGRLLRQDDVVVITDLVGLACVRYGAEGIYELAMREGNSELALTAAVVLGEVAPQRLLTSQRLTAIDLVDFASDGITGRPSLDLPDERLEQLIERAVSDPDRRFRAEALLALNLVAHLGPGGHLERATAVFDQIAAGEDEILAEIATWSRDTPPSDEYIAQALKRAE